MIVINDYLGSDSIVDREPYCEVLSALISRNRTIYIGCDSREDEAICWYYVFDGDVDAAIQWIETDILNPRIARSLVNAGLDPEF